MEKKRREEKRLELEGGKHLGRSWKGWKKGAGRELGESMECRETAWNGTGRDGKVGRDGWQGEERRECRERYWHTLWSTLAWLECIWAIWHLG